MGCEEDQTDVLWGDSDVEIDSGLPRRFAAAPAAGAGWSADLRGLAHLLFPFEAGSRLGPAELPTCRCGTACSLPMNSGAWCVVCGDCAEAVSGSSVGRRRKFALAPSIANRCRRIWFLSVVHDHRPVARWRPPRSTLLLRGQRTEFEAQRRRLPLQRLQDIGLHLGLVLFHRLRYVLLAVL